MRENHFLKTLDDELIRTFQHAVIVTASMASVILSTAEGQAFPGLLTPVVAIATCVLVDRRRMIRLPTVAASFLGIGAFIAAGSEFRSTGLEAKVLAGSHLIVYLTWIVCFLEKSSRQYWWILALSMLQLAVAAVLTNSAGFGASLIGMMLLLLWTLSVFSLYRAQTYVPVADESGMFSVGKDLTESGNIRIQSSIQRDPNEPWITWKFRGLVALSFLTSIGVAAFVFAAFPRVWVSASPFGASDNSQQRGQGIVHRTGFTDTITIGDAGNLLQSDARVLHFRVTDLKTGKEATPEQLSDALQMDELLFRGSVMSSYENGRWTRIDARNRIRVGSMFDGFSINDADAARYRLQIAQDAPSGQFAFAPFPVCRVETSPGSGVVRLRNGSSTLLWAASNRDADDLQISGQRSFQADCPELNEKDPLDTALWRIPSSTGLAVRSVLSWRYRRSAEEIYLQKNLRTTLQRLYQEAVTVCSESGNPVRADERVRRILKYLSADNGFRYSLSTTRIDTALDPVEDFLFNTKSGHCEYYASACALMLQSAGVPARLVNGFSGYEKNSVSGNYEVKQRHAHAWVEAFVDGRWITVDATPSAARETSLAGNAAPGFLGDLQTAVSDFWSDGIHSMTFQKQKSLYESVKEKINSIRASIRERGIIATITETWSDLVSAVLKWVNWGSASVLLILTAGVVVFLRRNHRTTVQRFLSAFFRWLKSRQTTSESVVRFYTAFCRVCESQGLRLSKANTAMENAVIASQFFADRLITEEQKQLPLTIAAGFNEIRFGAADVSTEQMQKIRGAVESFQSALKMSRTRAAAAVTSTAVTSAAVN